MNSGKHTVSIAVLVALACFAAREAGHDSATGADMGLIMATESSPPKAQVCSDIITGEPASLVFETIALDDADEGYPDLLISHAREVVDFEWNADTGELSYRTTTATRIFSDLERSSGQKASLAGPSCESR